MLIPRPPHPSYPPGPQPDPGESDPWLAAALRAPSWAADPYPLAALLARHWEPVYDLAVLCAPATGSAAAALAAAAVHQVLSALERSGPVAALRPQLLMAVRDIAAAWTADARSGTTAAPAAHPGTAGTVRCAAATDAAPGPAADPPGTAPHRPADHGDRRIARHAFESLPPVAQCLLWHTAVEAEPVSAPAALLALDIGAALTELERARGQFRSGLLHWHAELAGQAACRFYIRLLDSRGREETVLPDVRHHLLGCTHCTATAAQLELARRRAGLLLAQAVLGRPAEDYLASRPGRRPPGTDAHGSPAAGPPQASRAPRTGRGRQAGRHRLVSEDTAPVPLPPARPALRALRTGAGLASACALGAVLAVAVWPAGGTGAVPGPPVSPRTGSQAPDAEAPPAQVPPVPTPAAYRSASHPHAGAGAPDTAARSLHRPGDGTVVRSDGD